MTIDKTIDDLSVYFHTDIRPLDISKHISLKTGVVTHFYQDSDTGEFILYWTEGINDWAEKYTNLSTALLRLGALVACGEADWEKELSTGQSEFIQQSHTFLQSVVG